MQKGKVLEVVDAFSDDVDVDALIERLYLLRKIEIGEQQIASGQGVSHEEAKKRLEPWLKQPRGELDPGHDEVEQVLPLACRATG